MSQKKCETCGNYCKPSKAQAGPQGAVDPHDVANWDRVLWCVYGPDCFPSVFACKVNNASGMGAAIWGYSVYKRQPGFRTLGEDLKRWIADETERADGDAPVFFDSQMAAFDYLRSLVTPKVGT